jgi:hypothetical protein
MEVFHNMTKFFYEKSGTFQTSRILRRQKQEMRRSPLGGKFQALTA